MHPLVVSIGLLLLIASSGIATAGVSLSDAQPVDSESSDKPQIVEVYPNPPTYGDPGEFVTLEIPAGTNLSTLSLADDHLEVPLIQEASEPPVAETQRISFSTDTNVTATYTNRSTRQISDRLQLADHGDTIRLLKNGTVIDTVQYGPASQAEVYNAIDEEWHSLGATDKSIVSAAGGAVEVFVLPDSPERAIEFLDDAEERIFLAGYTLSSQAVVDALREAHNRDLQVEVLVDGSPVGGMSGRAATALDQLDRAGIDVRVHDGDRARYRFHHAKYAIVDDEALVTSENWKPSGTGGRSSRGWGAITDQEPIVDGLERTFHADTGWVDGIPWSEFDDLTLVDDERARGYYPTTFDAQTVPVDRTELLLAPDNANDRIRSVIRNADETLDIKQVQISDRGFPFLRDVLDAAERGVETRILLSGTWYAEAENRELKRWLNEQAAADDLPLDVKIAEPDDEFDKIHAKGLIVDGEQVLVGSINWNNNSVQHNREVALLLDGSEAGEYFTAVFDSDWEQSAGSDTELPAGLALAGLFVAVLAILGAKGLRFE